MYGRRRGHLRRAQSTWPVELACGEQEGRSWHRRRAKPIVESLQQEHAAIRADGLGVVRDQFTAWLEERKHLADVLRALVGQHLPEDSGSRDDVEARTRQIQFLPRTGREWDPHELDAIAESPVCCFARRIRIPSGSATTTPSAMNTEAFMGRGDAMHARGLEREWSGRRRIQRIVPLPASGLCSLLLTCAGAGPPMPAHPSDPSRRQSDPST